MGLSARTAVVTGASMGLGSAIARELAGLVSHLVLVARSEAALSGLARELEQSHGLRVTVVVLDLAQPGSAATLHGRLDGEPVDILVNNAGFGLIGGRRVVVPGLLNRLCVFAARFLPRRLMNRLSQKVIEG